mmetsp:Transcript_26924/g.39889  ORF Transcript_26924/g.39889 Transcript_26924/m.39889 type:complete len:81 (-) Transcript_26924:222-464(-)
MSCACNSSKQTCFMTTSYSLHPHYLLMRNFLEGQLKFVLHFGSNVKTCNCEMAATCAIKEIHRHGPSDYDTLDVVYCLHL